LRVLKCLMEYYRYSSRKKRFEIESVTSEDPYLTAVKIFLKIDLNKQTLNF
jgi:hypothetical protein